MQSLCMTCATRSTATHSNVRTRCINWSVSTQILRYLRRRSETLTVCDRPGVPLRDRRRRRARLRRAPGAAVLVPRTSTRPTSRSPASGERSPRGRHSANAPRRKNWPRPCLCWPTHRSFWTSVAFLAQDGDAPRGAVGSRRLKLRSWITWASRGRSGPPGDLSPATASIAPTSMQHRGSLQCQASMVGG